MSGQLSGRTYLVTGATDGIGLHSARRMAEMGANVLVHGRNDARVSNAVAAVEAAGGGGTVRGFAADLASLVEVRTLAEQVHAHCRSTGTKLTALVNNAGVYSPQRQLSHDGLELTFATNVAAPFLLTSLLVDDVAARVVNVASISAASSIDFGNLQQEHGYSAHGTYSLSKLCNILFSLELAQRLAAAGRSVTSNALDPGTVNTKMLLSGWGAIGMRVEDANYELAAATDDALEETSGKYFVGGREVRPPGVALDAAVRRQLWDALEQLTGAAWGV